MLFNDYDDALRFAIDCSIEVENQFYALKGFDGTFGYGEAIIDLSSLEGDDFEYEDDYFGLKEKVLGYRAALENLQDALSAAEDTLRGLEAASEFREKEFKEKELSA